MNRESKYCHVKYNHFFWNTTDMTIITSGSHNLRSFLSSKRTNLLVQDLYRCFKILFQICVLVYIDKQIYTCIFTGRVNNLRHYVDYTNMQSRISVFIPGVDNRNIHAYAPPFQSAAIHERTLSWYDRY
jgi:hypothetical protein